jgi:CheY-like chemotaxis protein/HPt (histidine-containing phosphotransfer) domain-containing protein
VEVQGSSGEAVRVAVRVTDTGIGISSEQQARLFEPFAQAEGDSTRTYGGTGLGLAICRKLAELMEGTVSLQSHPGQGTTLTLQLTLERAPAVVEADATLAVDGFVARPTPSLAEAESTHRLILLVDDHPTNRRVIAQQLALAGFACVGVADGQDALSEWRSGRFALVLTDVHMPVLDGYALATTIREEEARSGIARTPIVALTASALKEEAERCKAAGMDDYLAKPVSAQTLAATLQRWLHDDDGATARPDVVHVDPDTMLDRDVLQAAFGPDDATIGAVLEDFFASVDEDADVLEAAIPAREVATLARTAHRIKGAARLVGAIAIADLAGQLESAAQSSAWTQVQSLQMQLRSATRALRDHLREHPEA